LIIRLDAASLIEKLRGQEADLQTQLAQMTTQFGANYPKVTALNNQIKELQNRITIEMERLSERYKAEYLTALEREKMLRRTLEAQKQTANQLNESAIEFTILKREAETNRQLYDGLLSKLKEAGVSAGLRSSNIRIVDAARVPMRPARPNVPLYLALGVIVGMVSGVGLAFVVDGMDNTVATPEQAQTVSGLPSLAVIPLNDGAKGAAYARRLAYGRGRKQLTAGQNANSEAERKKVALVAHAYPQSQIAESYRALRTSILLSSLGHPPKIILVTSALPQEGKTTTSMNTAVVLAQRGGKVLLVDADMRRPSVHRVFGMRPSAGLSTLLSGLDKDEDVIVPSTEIPNLHVLPAGPIAPQPSELLASAEMKEHLHRWRQEYDHIVIDTPPVLSVTDAVVLSVEADAVVLVIRSGSTSKQALRHSRDLLMHVNARVRGIVVNGFDPRSPDAYQYYYYYGSKYANDYFEADAK
jgi:capsular exopolysaccharide synthesis family protein